MNLVTIAIVFLVYCALTFVYGVFNQKPVRLQMFVIGFAIVSQYVLTELKIGPASVRVYLMLPLVLLAIPQLGKSPSAKQKGTKIVVWTGFVGCFIALIVFNQIVNGEAFSAQSPFAYALDVLAERFVPIFFFLTIVAFAKKSGDVRFIATVLVVMIGTSSVLALLEYIGVSQVVGLKRYIHPLTSMRFDIQSRMGIVNIQKVGVSGLSSYSIPFAYSVLAFAPIALAYGLASRRSNPIFRLIAFAVFFIGVVAVYACKSRSGTIGMGACLFIAVFVAPVSLRGLRFGKYVQTAILVGVIGLVGSLVYEQVRPESFKYTDFEKMTSLQDNQRVKTALSAIDAIADNPVLGMGLEEFERLGNLPPHNTFLNAGVAGGVPGILFVLISFAIFGWIVFDVIKRRSVEETSWVTLGSFLGLMNYHWNGMTHNNSLVTGGVTLFVLLGLMIASHTIEMTDYRSKRVKARVRKSGSMRKTGVAVPTV